MFSDNPFLYSNKGAVVLFLICNISICNPNTTGFDIEVSILSTHSEYSLSDFPYEKTDCHTLPDDCHASWKCGFELGEQSKS